MGLVHHEHGDVQRGDPVHCLLPGQLLRREKKEDSLAGFGRLPGGLHFRVTAGRIYGDGGTLTQVPGKALQLVLLQGNEGRNHDGGALGLLVKVKCRYLVGGRFSVSGRHDCQNITALSKGAHAGELAIAQLRKGKGGRRKGSQGKVN
ncbi:hypothetical protein NtRootA4_06500 [Arthrobacter sp. NtRootA4]|nr:hypothetical protein NtRootA2_08730 [Arthrobacter sp. NtRootA2]BCW13671.1 hypothetical protein NtRootA4_06500 [Arthrobacter sp. NtRootA4]BCW22007.1 hypothetical protein NtRootC7_08740 [Arthrobacter sp. NtRootC7]BCW26275.1 hypothetical protein NtRootC45_08750 [Arthrobacter sp. NtRootC45]BCW30544.1 hypothetical protein NtRootD5_08750 [Arthrobacter sp. NtRootD5]